MVLNLHMQEERAALQAVITNKQALLTQALQESNSDVSEYPPLLQLQQAVAESEEQVLTLSEPILPLNAIYLYSNGVRQVSNLG